MDNKLKKIIAREGLIILLCIFLAIVVLIMPDIIVLKNTRQPIDLLTQEEHSIKDEEKNITHKVVINKGEDFKFNTEGQINKFLKKKGTVRKVELDISGLKGNLQIFIILLYPLYLIIRFILWAVKTLKKGE